MRGAAVIGAWLGAAAALPAAAQVVAVEQVAPAHHEESLPPPGTQSLFDTLIQYNDELPYPFEALVALVAEMGADETPPVALMIPDGRSLVRARGSYHRPRIVIGAAAQQPAMDDDSFGLMLRNRLFIGFVEEIDQLEVISYNPDAGRFEFQLVDDYREGGDSKISYASRDLCMACHQGGSPIFSVRPWDETNANPAVARRLREAGEGAARESYQGQPIEQPLAAAEAFDLMTDAAATLLATQDIWLDGCGGGAPRAAECRGRMLGEALRFAWNPGLYRSGSPGHEALIALQGELWPADGIAVLDPDLPSRDPLGGFGAAAEESWWSWLASLWPFGESAEDEEPLAGLSQLPAALDPLTPRAPKKVLAPSDDDGIYGLAQLFTRADIGRLKAASDGDFGRLERVLEGATSLYVYAPFERLRVMRTLLAGLGVEPLPEPCCATEGTLAGTGGIVEDQLELAAGSDLEPFRDYCFSCHRNNPIKWLNLMSGETEAEVWQTMLDNDKMLTVLDWAGLEGTAKAVDLMPPRKSRQYARMQDAEAAGEDPLATMRRALEAHGAN